VASGLQIGQGDEALPPGRVKVIYCSNGADYNYYNDAFSVDLNICCIFVSTGIGNPVASFSTISSYRYTDGGLIGDEGVDVYHVDLAPGWELSGMSFTIRSSTAAAGWGSRRASCKGRVPPRSSCRGPSAATAE
jgi:hypothetical protein